MTNLRSASAINKLKSERKWTTVNSLKLFRVPLKPVRRISLFFRSQFSIPAGFAVNIPPSDTEGEMMRDTVTGFVSSH